MSRQSRYMAQCGYRSGLEKKMADELNRRGIAFEFEQVTIPYLQSVGKGECLDCGSPNIKKAHKYTPDFWLPEYEFYAETKGRFLGGDRKKHVAIKESNPNIDIRFVFQRDDYLTAKKKQCYTGWCEAKGYKHFVMITKTRNREERLLPNEWFKEEHWL